MDFDIDCVDDLFQPAPTTVRSASKFQPKAKFQPKNKTVAEVPMCVPPLEESTLASTIKPSTCEVGAVSSEVHLTQEPHSETRELENHTGPPQDEVQASESDVKMQTDPSISGEEMAAVFSGMESLNELIQPSDISASKVGKFQPKFVSRKKEEKTKSVSFILPDPAETIEPSQCELSFSQNEGFEELTCNSTQIDCSYLQRMNEESLDRTAHLSSTSDHNQDFQIDHMTFGEKVVSEFSGFESLEGSVPQPTSTTVDSFDASERMCNSVATDWTEEQTNVVKTSDFQTESPGGNVLLETNDSNLENENYIGEDGQFLEVSEGTGMKDQLQNVDGQTDSILDETPTSGTVEDDDTSKSSRKLRKRIHISAEVDDKLSDDGIVEDSISQMDEDNNDDEYSGENVSKQKRGHGKSRKKTTESVKPVRRRKKVSEEPEYTEEEPPKKKKFPHTTTRKRRQVDKALLEMPESEIDPRQISIRNLIMLAEAKERLSNKVEAALRKSDLNLSGEQGNPDGQEAGDDIQATSKKLNYHSYMDRRQSTRWSKSETESFYQAICQFGTDFAMIQHLFPNRTRHQVKLKFKNEERKHPLQVADALVHRSKDHSHFELVIQQLQAQAEQKAQRDAYSDPPTDEQEEGGNRTKEEQDSKGWDGEASSLGKTSDCDGEAQSPDKFNEFQGVFDWDGFSF